MTRDLRDAWRQLRRRPILTIVAVLTLAVGTGANTSFLSLLNALVLRPLAVPAADRLVAVEEFDAGGGQHSFTAAMLQTLAARQQVFDSVCGYFGSGPTRIEIGSADLQGAWEFGSVECLATLGLHPELGRFLEATDEGQAVAVVTDAFWRERLSADPAIVGRSIRVNGMSVSIVGVAPPEYRGLQLESRADVFMLASSFNAVAGAPVTDPVYYGYLLGRLRDGADIAEARADVDALWPGVLADALADVSPTQRAVYRTRHLEVEAAGKGFSFLRDRYSGSLSLLVGLSVWMLVITGVTLAGALLAAAAAREAEFRIRVALGASRGNLLRALLTEAALLVFLGALVGLPVISVVMPRLLWFLWPSRVPMPISVAPDWRVFAASVGTMALVALVVGMVPAWLASRRGAGAAGGNLRTVVRTTSRWERSLLVAEIALSVVMLVGAGLFVRTLVNLRTVPLGFDVRGLINVTLIPKPGVGVDPDDREHARQLAEALTALPGVTGAGYIDHGLMLGMDNLGQTTVVPVHAPLDATGPGAVVEKITPGFLSTVAVPLERGRDFTWDDDVQSPRVALVTATEAARLFPRGDAIGQHIRIGTDATMQDVTIVGVAADSRIEDLHVPHPAAVFLSLAQEPHRLQWAFAEIRVSGDVAAASAAIRARVAAMGVQIVNGILPETDHVDIALARERLAATLGVIFAGLALGLVALGSYGLFSHWVTRRTRELGLRMALGASPVALRRWVLRQCATLAIAGIGLGVPAALAAAWLADASAFLFGLTAHDPLVLAIASALVLVAAILAVAGPASRVLRLDPLRALAIE
jgi:putative ABC transport system permease protein